MKGRKVSSTTTSGERSRWPSFSPASGARSCGIPPSVSGWRRSRQMPRRATTSLTVSWSKRSTWRSGGCTPLALVSRSRRTHRVRSWFPARASTKRCAPSNGSDSARRRRIATTRNGALGASKLGTLDPGGPAGVSEKPPTGSQRSGQSRSCRGQRAALLHRGATGGARLAGPLLPNAGSTIAPALACQKAGTYPGGPGLVGSISKARFLERPHHSWKPSNDRPSSVIALGFLRRICGRQGSAGGPEPTGTPYFPSASRPF